MVKRKIKKHYKKPAQHSFAIVSIRTISISVISFMLLFGTFIHASNQNVLGASTSLQACSWWNVFCYIQTIFYQQSTSPQNPSAITQPLQQNQQNQTANPTASQTALLPNARPTAIPTPTSIPGYTSYTSNQFHISLQYPEGDIPSTYLSTNGVQNWTQDSLTNLILNTAVPFPPYMQASQEEKSSVVFAGKNIVQVLLGENTTGLSLQNFVEQRIVAGKSAYPNREMKTYLQQFGTNQGVVVENLSDGRGTTVFLQNGTLVVSISVAQTKPLSELPTLSTVASSFTFQRQ